MQEALTLHSRKPLAANTMAGLAIAADIIAAVAAAGVRPDQKAHILSIDAYERPVLECLRVLCRQVCSAAAGGAEATVEASACCLCSVLRMCAELRYQVDDKVSCMCYGASVLRFRAGCVLSLASLSVLDTNLQPTPTCKVKVLSYTLTCCNAC